jgi:hypothetical protein
MNNFKEIMKTELKRRLQYIRDCKYFYSDIEASYVNGQENELKNLLDWLEEGKYE